MATFGTSGAKIYIGPANDTAATLAAFEALTFTEIKEVNDIGALDEQANEVSFISLGDARERIKKGTRKAIRPNLQMARDLTDPGQLALRAAAKTNNEYAFKIVFADQPAGGDQPTTGYFRAYVMGYSTPGVAPDGTLMAQTNLGATTELYEDLAA